MAGRVIKVKPQEFYRPIHDKTAEEFSKIGKKYNYDALELSEATRWDNFRYSDDTYRFNVQLLGLTRILDERDDTEYLTRVWRVSGKSEIGNDFSFIKEFSVDTYLVPKYETKVVAAKGTQSLRTEAGDITTLEKRFATPFTIDNVFEALKDSTPPDNLKYVSIGAGTYQGKRAVSMDKRHFTAWLLAPIEFLFEYNRSGNRALVDVDIDNLPIKLRNRANEFQLEKIKKILDDSNVIFLDQQSELERKEQEQNAILKGVSNEQPKETVKVKMKEAPKVEPERKAY